MSNFFDVYVKHMHLAATGLENIMKGLLESFVEGNMGHHPACKELKQAIQKNKLVYSSGFLKYFDQYIKEDPEIVGKIAALHDSRSPGANEDDKNSHVMAKVYQSMAFEDLMKFNSDDLPIHAVLDKELRSFAAVLMSQWFAMFSSLYALHKKLIEQYKRIHRSGKEERLLQQIIGSKEIDPELGAYNKEDIGTMHRTIARNKRNSGFFKQLLEFNSLKVEDEKYFLKADLVPIIFEETFLRFDKADSMFEMIHDESSETMESSKHSPPCSLGSNLVKNMMLNKKKTKFVFLSHGFQACHYDMLKIKHYFSNYRPDVRFICIKSNEEKTTEDIAQLGFNLATEVRKLIENDFVAGCIKSISFIGHSMGREE